MVDRSPAFRVEIHEAGCAVCRRGRTYHVVGPDQVAGSASYGDLDDFHEDGLSAAESLCDDLNHAYELGRRNQINLPWQPFTPETMPPDGPLLVWDKQFGLPTTLHYDAEIWTLQKLTDLQYTHWASVRALSSPFPPEKEPTYTEQVSIPDDEIFF